MLDFIQHNRNQPQPLQPEEVNRVRLVNPQRRDGRTLHGTHRVEPHQGGAANDASGRRDLHQGRGETGTSEERRSHPTGRRHLPHALGEPAPHPRKLEGTHERENPLHLL